MRPGRLSAEHKWHSNAILVQISRGAPVTGPVDDHRAGPLGQKAPVGPVKFGAVTLDLVADDIALYEQMALRRSSAFYDRDLVAFGARAMSTWALDVLAGRYTRFGHDWSSLRAAVLRFAESPRDTEPLLDEIALDRLYALCEVLHERQVDPSAERALLRFIASRAVAGGEFSEKSMDPFVERLLQAGLGDEARALLPRLAENTWLRHIYTAELEHPVHGGTFDSLLGVVNEPYRRVGFEPITLDGAGDLPFLRLDATPRTVIETGPLVTVIMTSWHPGPEIFTAVRSIIAQTYQNWELIVSDDASPADYDAVLDKVAALDPRIRVVRNPANAGTYVRRNEAIHVARGDFVTMQDSDDWSHPRRLEVQVRDLLSHSLRLANVVHASRVTEDFSVISRRGGRLFLAEPSLLFRREPVVAAIGYYDSIRKSADTEYRKRLEAVTRSAVPALLPGVPLQFMLADSASLSGGDFGTNIWNHPDRLTYWSATRRYLERIQNGAQDPYLPFPQEGRSFHAPVNWWTGPADDVDYDVVVVFDGRETASRADFHRTLVDELNTAVEAGLRLALVQSDALVGPRGMALWGRELQALVDSGRVARVNPDAVAHARVAVVRHASAAQGHPALPWGLSVDRAVVLEDASAGDSRGETIARRDVEETVAAWFAVEPAWGITLPALPSPVVTAVGFDGTRISVTARLDEKVQIGAFLLRRGESTVRLDEVATGAESVSASADVEALATGDWSISAEWSTTSGQIDTCRCVISEDVVIWNAADRIGIRVDEFVLRTLADDAAEHLPTGRQFASEYLSAVIDRIWVGADQIEISIADGAAVALDAVYALRDVDGIVMRKREFTAKESPAGDSIWARPLAKFSESRWEMYGTFRTPLGPVEYPLAFDEAVQLDANAGWRPEIVAGGRLWVAPAPTSDPVLKEVSPDDGDQLPLFGLRHSLPRVEEPPAVSVVMPVYNVEPFLEEAIASVLGQDWTDLELIIVDDASTDGGRRIIQRYWQQDARVRVFVLDHNTLGGAGVPSNIGIRNARGKYVAFADSDDHVTRSGLATLVELAEFHNAELVIGDFRTFAETRREGAEAYDHAVWSEFPLNRSISAFTHPALFRLSPVPWRKLYRRDFLEANAILYPEGDYFYEDNPLHWFVLSRAHRVVATKKVISFHRQEREGQTMSAQAYKLGSFVTHANTILNYLDQSTDERRNVLFAAFFEYLDRTQWTVKNQTQPAAAALLRRGIGDIFQHAVASAPAVPVPALLRPRLVTYRSAYPDLDLSVVVPVYNSGDLLRQTLDSVLELTGIRFNVLLVDDGSTDDSAEIMQEYERRHPNVHVFAQGNRGAGRARNSVIPLCTGRYTYFLDADDLVDARALAAAVAAADAQSADLLFVKYRIEFTDENRSQGMFGSDREIWSDLASAASSADRQRFLARVINYPWNRIIRTSLLHDANIFFGSTVVHNDVLFHWHSVVSATNIGYLDAEVCVHRKFATRAQVTNIDDERRMGVLEALRATHQRIADLPAYSNVSSEWISFALHLMDWAKGRVPESLHPLYEQRRAELVDSFEQ